MVRVQFHFSECIQDSQDYAAGDDEHMVSRVFFTIALGGQRRGDFMADLKQTVGDDYETGAIEVSPPRDKSGETYDGPMSHACFAQGAEKYFRSLVGSAGSGIHISGGSTNIRMRDNHYLVAFDWECEVDERQSSW